MAESTGIYFVSNSGKYTSGVVCNAISACNISTSTTEGNIDSAIFSKGGAVDWADVPVSPLRKENIIDVKQLAAKVNKKLECLRQKGEEFPEREFFRKKLVFFLEETCDADQIALQLCQQGVITDYTRKKIRREKWNFDKNEILYDIVSSKRAVAHLLPALKNSNNDHILAMIDKMAD